MKRRLFTRLFSIFCVSLLALTAVSCDKDDTVGGLPVTNIELPASSASEPLTEGSIATIKGKGFTSESRIWFAPSAKSVDGSVQAEITQVTESGISFVVPALSGNYDVTLQQGGNTFALGTLALLKNPVTGIVLPVSDAAHPLIQGNTATIGGSGFTSESEIWIALAANDDEAVEAEVVSATGQGLTFVVPSLNGECVVSLSQAGHEFVLGTVTVLACPVRGIELPASDAANPLPAGEAITIKGTGFTDGSEIWFTPAQGDAVPAATESVTETGISVVVPSLAGECAVSLKEGGHEFPIGSAVVEPQASEADLVGEWTSVQDRWDLNLPGTAYLLDEDGQIVYDENDKPVSLTLKQYCDNFAAAYNEANPDTPITAEDISSNNYTDGTFIRFEFSEAGIFTMKFGITSIGLTATHISDAPYSYDPLTKTLTIHDPVYERDLICKVDKFTKTELVFNLKEYYPFSAVNYEKTQEYYIYATTQFTCSKAE